MLQVQNDNTDITHYYQKDMQSKHNKIHLVNTTSTKTSVKYTKHIYTSGILRMDNKHEWYFLNAHTQLAILEIFDQ